MTENDQAKPLTRASHSPNEYQRAEAEPRTQTLVEEYPETEMLPGWVNAYYVYENGRKCGPYYVRRWKVRGKLHKQYVAERHLRRTLAACARYRERKIRGRDIALQVAVVTGNLSFLWTMVKRSMKGTLRPCDHDFLAILEKEGPKASGRPSLKAPKRTAKLASFKLPTANQAPYGPLFDKSENKARLSPADPVADPESRRACATTGHLRRVDPRVGA